MSFVGACVQCSSRLGRRTGDSIINYYTPGSPGMAILRVAELITSIVIASLGIAGVISPAALGGTFIGLAVFTVLINRCLEWDAGKHMGKCNIITRLALSILLGVLTITGVMAASTLGWIMLAVPLTIASFAVYCSPCIVGGVALRRQLG